MSETSDDFITELKKVVSGDLFTSEPLARYTTLKIGGPADALFFPQSLEDLACALRLSKANHIPVFILGNGSNLLIRDGGIRGLVIKLHKGLNQIDCDEKNPDLLKISAGAGVQLPRLVELAKQKGYTGLESLYGIPGTVGGALFMNAGTREGEIETLVASVQTLTFDGKQKNYPREKLTFEYRSLKLSKYEVLIGTVLELKKSTPEAVTERVSFFQSRRFKTQPLDEPNCGSVFKNPKKKFAAELIEELGLKGVRVGGARISEKHANWIVNEGGASARDVMALIGLARDKVKEVYDIRLETEVKIVGEDLLT